MFYFIKQVKNFSQHSSRQARCFSTVFFQNYAQVEIIYYFKYTTAMWVPILRARIPLTPTLNIRGEQFWLCTVRLLVVPFTCFVSSWLTADARAPSVHCTQRKRDWGEREDERDSCLAVAHQAAAQEIDGCESREGQLGN